MQAFLVDDDSSLDNGVDSAVHYQYFHHYSNEYSQC